MSRENLQIVATPGAAAGQRILYLKGPLTLHTVFEFQNALRAEDSETLILDFSGVPFIDSSGLGALVSAQVTLGKLMRKLALVGMNEPVRALLDMTHVGQLFRTYSSIQEAESRLSSL